MSPAVRRLLDSFEWLSEGERRELASEIIGRVAPLEYPPLSDETLALVAEEQFLEFDVSEARDEHESHG